MDKIVNCWLNVQAAYDRGFIQILKLWLNPCSFRCLNPSWSFVINLNPSRFKMANAELGMGWIIFIRLALKILLKLDVWILKLSLFHSFIIHGKKEYLNASVLQEYVVIFLVFQVLCHWDSEGLTQLNKMEFHYF